MKEIEKDMIKLSKYMHRLKEKYPEWNIGTYFVNSVRSDFDLITTTWSNKEVINKYDIVDNNYDDIEVRIINIKGEVEDE